MPVPDGRPLQENGTRSSSPQRVHKRRRKPLKTELVHDMIFTSREAAKTTIAEWIEIFYNGTRRHSSLDYLSPLEFERRYYENLERTKAA